MSRWTFATGKLIDIDDLTERFGMTFAREPGTVPFNHNLRTVVIDATGKVQKVFVGNEWQADALVSELEKAAKKYGVTEIALAGGVSANSELRKRFEALGPKHHWKAHIPAFEYCTDNAAMIAIAAHYKFLNSDFASQEPEPLARYKL